ncbi:MAG TPA: Rne/Rng family ribonuclease [Thermoanaerobaculia bacterium]|nr:Rne/Rng family ribonuclease [Thermoanaerobaculia bacterium]
MLINAQRPEEVRIAIVDGSELENYQVEAAETTQTRGNIYRGIVAALQPSLNAAFIDYGAEKNGFLSLDNLVSAAYHHRPAGGKRPRIEEVLERGRPVLVQVAREPEGQKGAALVTDISLAGRYLVFTPYDETLGVSRKVEDEEERKQLREIASSLRVPEGGGVIIRTNAVEQNKTAVSRDLQALLRLWKQIQTESKKGSGPKLLQSDQDLILCALRDYLDASIAEIVVDDEAAFEKAQEYVRAFLPRSRTTLVRYSDRTPLFARYDLESQIDRIYERSVDLPSGGSIVIDRTEALVAVDVNSGRSRAGGSHEETVLNTNLEAAREVGRQLQLRDIGGLIVVDFIDMKNPRNRRKVETAVKDALKTDKARTTTGRLSANGLLEINRQKIRQALHLRTHRACPTCAGTGRIASPEMVSLNLLRRIEARATMSPLRKVRVALHPELADAFQNTRRQEIAGLEREFSLRIEVIAASHLHRPQQEIEWFEAEGAIAPPPAPRAVAPVKAAPPQAPQAEPQAPQQQGDETSAGRKRRRRRRRRGHEPAAAEFAEITESTQHPHLPPPLAGLESFEAAIPHSPEDEEHAHDPHDAHEAPPSPGKKRRRRRRRGGRSSEGAATMAASAGNHVAEERPPVQPVAAAAPEENGHPAEEKRPKRRSRRRRKPHAEGSAPAAVDEAPEPVDAPPDTAAPSAAPAGPRRRNPPRGGGKHVQGAPRAKTCRSGTGEANLPGPRAGRGGAPRHKAPAKARLPRRASDSRLRWSRGRVRSTIVGEDISVDRPREPG